MVKGGYKMSEFNWCHGPRCHKQHTQDRVRVVKGSKVLRTRKIKLQEWNRDRWDRYFCSTYCQNDFWNKYADQIVAIAPRTECLETPINQPKRVQNEYGWVHTEITVDETRSTNVG